MEFRTLRKGHHHRLRAPLRRPRRAALFVRAGLSPARANSPSPRWQAGAAGLLRGPTAGLAAPDRPSLNASDRSTEKGVWHLMEAHTESLSVIPAVSLKRFRRAATGPGDT
jgi:hypothetical protein